MFYFSCPDIYFPNFCIWNLLRNFGAWSETTLTNLWRGVFQFNEFYCLLFKQPTYREKILYRSGQINRNTIFHARINKLIWLSAAASTMKSCCQKMCKKYYSVISRRTKTLPRASRYYIFNHLLWNVAENLRDLTSFMWKQLFLNNFAKPQ